MNLIEKLGLEKCKEIVDGAPETATIYFNGQYFEEWSHNGWVVAIDGQWVDCKKPKGKLIKLDDLHTALIEHEEYECLLLEADDTSLGDFEAEMSAKFKVGGDTDMVTDIRNHISPNTKVIER